MQFLFREEKVIAELHESLRSEFFVKISVKGFALSDAENKTSEPFTRKRVADLPFLTFAKSLRN